MKLAVIPALLGFALSSPAVFAATAPHAEATFDWSAVTFTLFDLTPADSLSPTVTWSGQHGNTSSSASSYDNMHSSSVSESYVAPNATSVVTSNSVTSYASGVSTYDNQALSVVSSADLALAPTTGYSYGSSGASASFSASFKLSGAGVMVVSVPYLLSVTGGGVYNWNNYSYANANINSSFRASDGSFSGSESANKSFRSYYDGNKTYSGIYTFSVANPNDLIFTSGSLSASLSSNAYTSVAAVPEPETYAMMLAGLGMIGSVMRRRTRRSA